MQHRCTRGLWGTQQLDGTAEADAVRTHDPVDGRGPPCRARGSWPGSRRVRAPGRRGTGSGPLVDDAPRPFRSPEDALGDHLADFAELGPADRELVLRFIEALVTKTRLKLLAGAVEAAEGRGLRAAAGR
jgi:hypothetical protein